MKKLIFLLLIFCTYNVFGQFSQTDRELIYTTLTREFNKNIINNYLYSNNPVSVNAALLSLANSKDTLWASSIISQDYDKHTNYIPFSLGQLGYSANSINYLFDKLKLSENPYQINIAIGKLADSLAAERLINCYSNKSIPLTGFPTALVSIYRNNLLKDRIPSLLLKMLSDNSYNENREEILYAISRITPHENTIVQFDSLLKQDDISDNEILNILRGMRKLESAPTDSNTICNLKNNTSWTIRNELARSLQFIRDKNEVISHLLLLAEDSNPNVAVTTLISLRNIDAEFKIPSNMEIVFNKILSGKYSDKLKGETFLTLSHFSNDSHTNLINQYRDNVKPLYFAKLLSESDSSYRETFQLLREMVNNDDELTRMEVYNSILQLQDSLLTDSLYCETILSLFASNKPAPLAILAEGLKKPIIGSISDELQEILLKRTLSLKDNPQFNETLLSFIRLSSKVSGDYLQTILSILERSEIASVRNYVLKLSGKKSKQTKFDSALFAKIWDSAFKYRTATIKTNKGSFSIELLPEFAPISVGNFIKITEEGFYDNVSFHRVVPGFVIQTGDPSGTGWSGPGYEIITESSPLSFDKGYVGMASAGNDTEGSQWFVMQEDYPHLNGRYTIFGKLIEGENIVSIIEQEDRIISIDLR